MSRSSHFSASTAAALIVGGIAAIALATAIALRDADPAEPKKASPSASTTSAAPEVDVEYLAPTDPK